MQTFIKYSVIKDISVFSFTTQTKGTKTKQYFFTLIITKLY